MKKLLATILALVMALSLCSVSWAEESLEFGKITVYKAGETTGTEYDTFKAALEVINADASYNNARLECEAGKLIANGGNHISVTRSITVNGNGATLVVAKKADGTAQRGEADFAIEEYANFSGDVKLVINNLKNASVWGTRKTAHTFTLEMNNCETNNDYVNSKETVTAQNPRVYINGTTGVNNITLYNCKYTAPTLTTVYSNAAGSVTVTNAEFKNVVVPINLNNKSNGKQEVKVENCRFEDCATTSAATEASAGDYAAPVRVVASGTGASSELSVNDCTFAYANSENLTPNGDILLGHGSGTSNPVNATVTKTNATVTKKAANKEDEHANVTEDQKLEAKGESAMIVSSNTPSTSSTGGYYYYQPTTDTKTDTTKGSPKTFDAGVGIYAVTAVLSVTGMAWTAKKRH